MSFIRVCCDCDIIMFYCRTSLAIMSWKVDVSNKQDFSEHDNSTRDSHNARDDHSTNRSGNSYDDHRIYDNSDRRTYTNDDHRIYDYRNMSTTTNDNRQYGDNCKHTETITKR